MNKETTELKNIGIKIRIHGFSVTRFEEKQRQIFKFTSNPNLIVANINNQQTRINLRMGPRNVFVGDSVALILNDTSYLQLEIFHQGTLGKKLIGRIELDRENLRSFEPGTHKFSRDLGGARRDMHMQLSFFLDILSGDGDRAECPLTLNHDVAAHVTVQSATDDSAGAISEPRTLSMVSETVDTAIAVRSAYATAENVAAYYAPLGQALELVDQLLNAVSALAEVHFIVKTTYLALSSAYWVLRKQTELDSAVKELAIAMVKLFSWVKETEALDQKLQHFCKTIELMAQQATECALFVKDYASRGFLGRTVHSNLNSVEQTVLRFRQNFDALLREFDRGAILSTFTLLTRSDTAVRDMLDKLHDSQTREDKRELMRSFDKGLPHVPDAYFDPGRTCLSGTRQKILDEIYAWSREADGQSIYWLRAEAGAGKTTISHSIASQAAELGQLGGCFFLHRDYAKRRDPRIIINTLAFRLAHFHPDVAAEIKAALDKDPDLGSINSIQIKFDRLILDPIAAVKTLVEPILLIIDDLDSLDTKDEDARARRQDLLSYIGRHHQKFPLTLKVLVTSRPEWDIIHELKSIRPHTLHHSSSDIACLARKLLDEIVIKFRLRSPWPEAAEFDALVQHSGQLFIWIKTACQFIGQRDPQRRLSLILKGDPLHGAGLQLNKLYRDALLNHAERDDDDDSEFYGRFRKILGCIANLRSPLTPEAIDSVLGFTPDIHSRYTIELFESFLHITEEGVVRPIHPSFIEFLTNEQRCNSPLLFIGHEHKQNLARRCIQLMLTSLRRNVCNFEDPLGRNDISRKEKLPKDLLYACQFWADHLQSVQADEDIYRLVEEFFFTKILFWLEVMSLAGLVDDLIPALLAAKAWVEGFSPKAPNLLVLIDDTQHFVQEFRPVLLKSAGYIYESALPLTPHNTLLFQTSSILAGKLPPVHAAYQNWEPHRIIEVCSAPVRSAAWSPDSRKIVIGTGSHDVFICNAMDGSIGEALRGHTGMVESVVFSPDGKAIASGSEDGTIRIWDVDSNELLREIPVHEGTVGSIAFSPDGRKIASGSYRICIWNVDDGSPAVWFQYSEPIYSVAFSHDGLRLVSGSSDGTVRIWNADDGVAIQDPFLGHENTVYSVAFSPDGKRIVSASRDTTVRVWDTIDGTLAVKPPISHGRNQVFSAQFSPDGTKIVTGSDDSTIRVWDAITGTLIGKVLKHAAPVMTVAFSPDGKKMLSGSYDATVRIWCVSDANLFGERTMEGHTDRILSVAFSPDGSKIVSSSWDSMIFCWNAIDGTLVRPLPGHNDVVSCARFSFDGIKVASASWDCTVHIWNLEDESDVGQILTGHTDRVRAVEFSPDGTRIVSSSSDSTLRIWNVVDGTQVGEPLEGHAHTSPVISFCPDGTQFVSADNENSMRLWNIGDGTLAGRFERHGEDLVLGAAFSPDGTRIITGSYDHIIRLWDVANKSLLSTFPQYHFETWIGTGGTSDNEIPDSIVALYDLLRTKPNMLILLGGWIKIASTSKRLWIPPRYRGAIAMNAGRVCIGTTTGHVVIVETLKD